MARFTRFVAIPALAAFLMCAAQAVNAQSDQVTIRKVVFEGDPAPGGGTFDRFGSLMRTSNNGEVAFTARVDNAGELLDGLFLWDGTDVHSLIREGDVLPDGTVTDVPYGTNWFVLNRHGDVAIGIRVQEPDGEVHRLVVVSTKSIRTVVSAGDPTPQGGSEVFLGGDIPRINDSGTVAFKTSVTTNGGPSVAAYYVASSDGTLTEVARETECGTDPANDELIKEFALGTQAPNLNVRDSVSFLATLCNGDRVTCLWTYEEGLRYVLQTGEPSPVSGEPMEIPDLILEYGSPWFAPSLLDDHDQILVIAEPPIGYYFVSDLGVEPVWVRDDPLDEPFEDAVIFVDTALNNRRTVVGQLRGPIGTNVDVQVMKFRDRYGQQIFQDGQAIPDLAGVHFDGSTHALMNNFNDIGQVVFIADVDVPELGLGLFMTDCQGTIHTLAAETLTITVDGQEYLVSTPINGVWYNVVLIDTAPAEGVRALSDRGEFAFWAGLTSDDYPDGIGTILIASIDGCPCRGDTDLDGIVSVFDLLAVLSQWGPCDGFCEGDLDFDHVVGVQDLLTVLSGWGPCE